MKKLPKFIPGLELNRLFFREIVGPLMASEFPDLKYSAALIGNGSDVMGYDDPTSMDHNWGPKMRMFFAEKDFRKTMPKVNAMLRKKLPYSFLGFPTNFTKQTNSYLVQQMKAVDSGEVNHLIKFYTIKSFSEYYIGMDARKKLTYKDWLTFPEQALLEIVSGEVFRDDVGLEKLRDKLAYYPHEIWMYIMDIQWGRIANEQSYVARSGAAGDELGSHIIAARLIRRLMKLCFILERKYAPYTKWFGTSFSKLNIYNKINPLLLRILKSGNWKEREYWLGKAYVALAKKHNTLGITKPMPTKLRDYYGRPYRVIHAEEFYEEIKKNIKDKKLRNMKFNLGSVDQFIDHTRINQVNYFYRKLRDLIV